MVELMIVIAIIGILAVTLIPAFSGMQNRAKDTGIVNNVSGAATALDAWRIDTPGVQYPISPTQAASAVMTTANSQINTNTRLTAYQAVFTALRANSLCMSTISSFTTPWLGGAAQTYDCPRGGAYSIGYLAATNLSHRDSYVIWARLTGSSKWNVNTAPMKDGTTPVSYISTGASVQVGGISYYWVHWASRNQ